MHLWAGIPKEPSTRAKQAGVEVAEKKELIGTLAKFQIALQQIDSYHHVVLPPLYKQVTYFLSILVSTASALVVVVV